MSECDWDVDRDGTCPMHGMPDDPWMRVLVVAPEEVGRAVVAFLRNDHGFDHTDWCVMTRDDDASRVDYDPCEPVVGEEKAP